MKKYTLILLSGGVGSRMKNPVPKQYMLLAGKPMIMHIIERADCLSQIESIIIVCAEEYRSMIELMIMQYGIKKPYSFALAGETRQASVFSGLKNVNTEDVIIHEAARPFVSVDDFEELINDASSNATIGMDIPFTVVKGHSDVEGILNRSELVNVQLPQKFNTEQLLLAHYKAKADNRIFTEDVSLLYYYNPTSMIKIIRGKEYNIKITTRTDMLSGEIIYDEYFRRIK